MEQIEKRTNDTCRWKMKQNREQNRTEPGISIVEYRRKDITMVRRTLGAAKLRMRTYEMA